MDSMSKEILAWVKNTMASLTQSLEDTKVFLNKNNLNDSTKIKAFNLCIVGFNQVLTTIDEIKEEDDLASEVYIALDELSSVIVNCKKEINELFKISNTNLN